MPQPVRKKALSVATTQDFHSKDAPIFGEQANPRKGLTICQVLRTRGRSLVRHQAIWFAVYRQAGH